MGEDICYIEDMRIRRAGLGDARADRSIRSLTEFRPPLRDALENGVTPDEIEDIILHSSIQAGFPAAANEAQIAPAVCGNP